MNTKEFQNYLSQITLLLTGNIENKEEAISALEAVVSDPDLQQPHAEDFAAQIQRKHVLIYATSGASAYQNLHVVLRNHSKAAKVCQGIATLWAAEASSAQSHYDSEDELFNEVARGYFPSTPYERWFVTGTEKEVGGLVAQREREQMRTRYLQYCKTREAEYKRASQ